MVALSGFYSLQNFRLPIKCSLNITSLCACYRVRVNNIVLLYFNLVSLYVFKTHVKSAVFYGSLIITVSNIFKSCKNFVLFFHGKCKQTVQELCYIRSHILVNLEPSEFIVKRFVKPHFSKYILRIKTGYSSVAEPAIKFSQRL